MELDFPPRDVDRLSTFINQKIQELRANPNNAHRNMKELRKLAKLEWNVTQDLFNRSQLVGYTISVIPHIRSEFEADNLPAPTMTELVILAKDRYTALWDYIESHIVNPELVNGPLRANFTFARNGTIDAASMKLLRDANFFDYFTLLV
jgi:hypothetical protein